MIYTAKTKLIRAKINRLHYNIMCHYLSESVKKLITAKLFINLGQMWLKLAQLTPILFSLLRQTKQRPPQDPGPRAPTWINPSLHLTIFRQPEKFPRTDRQTNLCLLTDHRINPYRGEDVFSESMVCRLT